MKPMRIIFFGVLQVMTFQLSAQTHLPRQAGDTAYFSTYYEQKLTLFNTLPLDKNDIVFLGNSLTDIGEWAEIWQNPRVKNRGISGDNSFGVLARIEQVAAAQPRKIFLMIGINDLARNTPVNTIFQNIQAIVDKIKKASPKTQVVLQSVLPTNNQFTAFARHQNKDEAIRQLNYLLEQWALHQNLVFVNLYPLYLDDAGRLSTNFTNDGLHLKAAGYWLWKKTLQDLKLL